MLPVSCLVSFTGLTNFWSVLGCMNLLKEPYILLSVRRANSFDPMFSQVHAWHSHCGACLNKRMKVICA